MEAVIKVRPDELGLELLDKIKSFIQNENTTEIIIQVREKSSPAFDEASPDDYWRQFNASVADKEAGRTTVFTMEEFRQYVSDNFSQ